MLQEKFPLKLLHICAFICFKTLFAVLSLYFITILYNSLAIHRFPGTELFPPRQICPFIFPHRHFNPLRWQLVRGP